MELEKIYSDETSDIYAVSAVRKEFRKAVILLVAFLEKNDGDYQRAIKTAKIRLTWLKC